MIPGRVFLVAVLAIAVTFEQATALECRKCDSKQNKACLDSPGDIEATQCTLEVSTTAVPSTVGSSSSTTPSTVGSSSSTTPSTVGSSSPTTPSTVGSSSSTTPSTVGSSSPTTPSTVGSSSSTTPSTVGSSSPTTPSTLASSSSTASSTVESSSSTTLSGEVDPDPADGANPNPNQQSMESPENPIATRFKRAAFLREDASFVCFKLVYKEGETDVVERGCASKSDDPCKQLKENKSNAECNTCDEDGCNASSRISLGMSSILVPALIMMFLR